MFNPFKFIFSLLAILFIANHLTGQITLEIITGLAAVLYFLEYLSWANVVSSEPSFMPGMTNKIFFTKYGRFRWKMILAHIFTAFTLISTLINTYNIRGE